MTPAIRDKIRRKKRNKPRRHKGTEENKKRFEQKIAKGRKGKNLQSENMSKRNCPPMYSPPFALFASFCSNLLFLLLLGVSVPLWFTFLESIE
jgi:hypothetical protein